jgi:porphobilinogen synthase
MPALDLIQRPRRLRTSAALRALVRETLLHPGDFVLPLFVSEKLSAPAPVESMPGVSQLTEAALVEEAGAAHAEGVPAVLLFGIPKHKDPEASQAYAEDGVVQRSVRALKAAVPGLLVITDVCLCEFMSHGHCGITRFEAGQAHVLNDPSVELLTRTAVSHAKAGADIVAPSDMMDGRIGGMRSGLDAAGFEHTPILSYAAKFASAFYGPFRDAAESAPSAGDRRGYQMDAANGSEALREVALDLEEGADMVIVKPGLAYLDIIHRVKARFGVPTFAYHVSGEYSMLKAAAARGWVDEKATLLETMTAFRRAGADRIITYAARDLARWLRT